MVFLNPPPGTQFVPFIQPILGDVYDHGPNDAYTEPVEGEMGHALEEEA